VADATLTVEGQDLITAALAEMGTSQQTEVDAALTAHGKVVQAEAIRLAPKRTGATARGATTTFTTGTGLTVDANSALHPAAYTHHAMFLGKSNGYMVFRVPLHNRRGYTVTGYNALRPIKNNPYLFTAWTSKLPALETAVADALTRVVSSG